MTTTSQPIGRRRLPLLLLLIALAIAGAIALSVYVSNFLLGREPSVRTSVGGPFRLASSKGEVLSSDDLKGKPFAIFFGFTHCPDVCPTTLWDMSQSLERLRTGGLGLPVLFVSLDPERDTPQVLASYIDAFDTQIVGLSGTSEEIARLARAYRVYWKRVPGKDGDYTLDHTATVYLMDARGQFAGTIGYGEDASSRDAKLRRLIAGEPSAVGHSGS
ncbi:electron transport SCO1/SenC protein [Azorhizobium caulinodans ORS 571]|uniref:Electron transport SCO1/SenC protein n=1 Tax=Azorhizobium caulinodans (strain ATCC 43989 / DSM 5975 / JCM 20966 / LMG 6465 / NBRC 14845 / NCIMB 13405 / ORS 571) TaxID=438753 RepID=A8I165_AZOC5|nr:SCO family protein [Azorhizobium caulinodans]BAF87337.1 electron transport SCO1/SenC protein [Azorhizobium caulinodans ORS 571]